MYQYYTFDKPVPSLPLYKITFKDGEWTYTYQVTTPVPLKNKPYTKPLYLEGSFLDLKLTKDCPKDMINLEIYSKKDLETLFKRQRISDNAMRKEFKQTELSKILKEQTFTVKNKSQKMYGAYIVRQKRKTDTETTFVGRIY